MIDCCTTRSKRSSQVSLTNLMKNLRIPGLVQVLPEGYACAATDRCFLLANCCTLLRRETILHLIYQRKKEDERRKEEKSLHLSCSPLAPRHPVGWEESLKQERETRGRTFLCRIAIERKPGEARTRGWSAPIHKGKNVTLMSLRPWSILTISSRGRRDLTQCRQPKSEIYYSSNSLRLGSSCLYCLFIVHKFLVVAVEPGS